MTGEVTFLGVDGGGSGLRAVWRDQDGVLLGRAQGPPANVASGGIGQLRQALKAVLAELRRQAPASKVAACLGLAGVSLPSRAQAARRVAVSTLQEAGFGPVWCQVVTDGHLALEAATLGQPGGVLVAGTGSVAFARGENGRIERCGGWGLSLGDEGSGAWLGREAMRRALRQADGREAPTRLLPTVLEALGAAEPSHLVKVVYGPPPMTPRRYADLAPQVLDLAQEGDPAARELVDQGAQELAFLVATLWRRLGLAPQHPLGLAGGLLRHPTPLAHHLTHVALPRMLPGLSAQPLRLDPQEAAAFQAARSQLGAQAWKRWSQVLGVQEDGAPRLVKGL